jgi:hypothetical protein
MSQEYRFRRWPLVVPTLYMALVALQSWGSHGSPALGVTTTALFILLLLQVIVPTRPGFWSLAIFLGVVVAGWTVGLAGSAGGALPARGVSALPLAAILGLLLWLVRPRLEPVAEIVSPQPDAEVPAGDGSPS